MIDFLPAGTYVTPHDDPHAHYRWRVQYDNVQGPWVEEYDEHGRSRSTSQLDWTRVCRVELIPQDPTRPIFELRVHMHEKGNKFWQVEARPSPLKQTADLTVREVLSLHLSCEKTVFLLYDYERNRVILTTNDNI